MDSSSIRNKFFAFFKEKGHEIVSSAPMVLKNDPTLMFTNAGMNQFKDYFLGNKQPETTRVADTQKCLRVSGKHNDLEEVGKDTYHHTMFEMLGNWSFGDYFKKEAISWAWELLTEVYGIPKERLYASVFGGDKEDGQEMDAEAYDYWKAIIPEERIVSGSKKDNFWEMGEVGPCGPCSEIHVDLRPADEIKKVPGRDLVNQDHPQVIEIWNLVFIQYNRLSNGDLEALPDKHVDTGMGFERLCMAIQGTYSNYDTDVFSKQISFIADLAKVTYGKDEQTDISIRVIVDHIRAIVFAIGDGQLPSNTGAGYVIRRILRRAVRYGFTYLNLKEPFLYQLVPLLANQFTEVFPEIKKQQSFIEKVVLEEETSFLRTLDKGLQRIDVYLSKANEMSGEQVFELYDTFGFPLDLTKLIAEERGVEIDEDGFKRCMQQQKSRSKAAGEMKMGDWITLKEVKAVQFLGYDQLTSQSEITKYRKVSEKGKEFYQIVLDKTPFYAESGGQVGDTGVLLKGDEKIGVLDTKKENDLIIHYVKALPKELDGIFDVRVNENKRQLTENNHSATHLLQAALQQVLGEHVAQKGSYVNENILRFDFAHMAKMTEEEIAQVEAIVNAKIRENIVLDEQRDVPFKEAQGMGAMALFGEKYGNKVRVITFDEDYSVELCGGTHVAATGMIGQIKIIAETSVAAGVRRIEALTAKSAEDYINKKLAIVDEVSFLLKNPKDLKKAVDDLIKEKTALQKQLEKLQAGHASDLKGELVKKANKSGDINVIVEQVVLPNADVLKKLCFELKNEVENLVLVLAADLGGKPQISIMMADHLPAQLGLNAGTMVRELAQEIKGGGGGQPFFATAGGKEISGLPAVVEKASDMISKAL